MASKSKLYIMVMLCKPQNLHFRAERISTNNKAKFYISHLCNITRVRVILQKGRGSWNQIPKVLPACSELATLFHIDMQPPQCLLFQAEWMPSLIQYGTFTPFSSSVCSRFHFTLKVKAVYFGVFISSQSPRLDFLLSSLNQQI